LLVFLSFVYKYKTGLECTGDIKRIDTEKYFSPILFFFFGYAGVRTQTSHLAGILPFYPFYQPSPILIVVEYPEETTFSVMQVQPWECSHISFRFF
jgi:hypothetical protein